MFGFSPEHSAVTFLLLQFHLVPILPSVVTRPCVEEQTARTSLILTAALLVSDPRAMHGL